MNRALILPIARAIVAALLGMAGGAFAEPVWLVSNGFHSSIAVRRSDASTSLAGLTADPRADHLLIGWGAAGFYTAEGVSPLSVCRAIFLPTPSALHLVPVRGPLHTRFSHSHVLRFDVPPAKIRELGRFLDSAVRRDATGRPVLLCPGTSPGSRFYAGRETFWFPVTCNVWCARALRHAGVPVSLVRAVAAGSLVRQVRRHAHREATRRRPLDSF